MQKQLPFDVLLAILLIAEHLMELLQEFPSSLGTQIGGNILPFLKIKWMTVVVLYQRWSLIGLVQKELEHFLQEEKEELLMLKPM